MPMDVITWAHVPPGTQVEVSVEPPDGGFVSGGDIFMADKGLLPIKQWSDSELCPGPAIEVLKDGVDYTIDIRPVSVALDAVEGKLTGVLKVVATGAVLAKQERTFRLEPRTHHLLRIFIDADALLEPEAPTPRAARAPRERSRVRSRSGRKRGK